MRRGLKALVETHAGWTVCAEARSGREAVELTAKLRPDIAVLDITMPDLNGLEAARRIQKLHHRTEILILSMHYSDQLVRDVIEAGIRGYVLKSDSDRDLLIAIEALANHNPFFTPLATESVLGSFHSDKTIVDKAAPAEDRLSSRQREVLQLLSEGKSSKEVASALGITLKTANTHRSNLMRKMKVHNVTHLVRYAVRNFIIEP